MKVCARVDPSMSTASKGVDARHNLHVAVDIVALRASRDESQLQCVKDLERGFPTCERNDVALSQRASGVSAHIVEAKAAMNADVRVVIKVAPGYHTAEIPAERGIPEGAHSSPDDFGLQTAGLPAALRAAGCGLMIGGERVASLLHMDDSGIFARDEADLRRELDVGFEWLWRHGHMANGEKLEFAALADHSRAPLTFDYVWLPSEADEPDIMRRAAALVHN